MSKKTPEGKVKDAVTKILKEHNAYYFFPVTGGFGRSGVPDIVACYRGWFIGIECKAGNNEPTELQKRELKRIDDMGGFALVLNEDNAHTIENVLTMLDDVKLFQKG